MTEPTGYTSLGKQVLYNGKHYADACNPQAAAWIVRALKAAR